MTNENDDIAGRLHEMTGGAPEPARNRPATPAGTENPSPRLARPAAPPPARQLPVTSAPRNGNHRASDLRRTMIPILLTLTLILTGLALLWFNLDADSPIRAIGGSFPLLAGAGAVICAALAGINMLKERPHGPADRSR